VGRNSRCAVLALVAVWNAGLLAQEERVLTRVRGAGETMRALIREGDARSESFRAMVDEIQRSNAVVMVQFGLCANGQFRSCVVHVAGDTRQRHVRILVNTRTTNDRLIATIAHELYHSLEIIRAPEVTTSEQALALYRGIAKGACGKGLDDRCETEAALGAEATVLGELDRSPRR
jgi:hypothetical protein